MTKKVNKAEFNAFVQGFITEANPLNFPPNASSDEENFELSKKGVRSRRLGMDFEDGYSLVQAGIQPSDIETKFPEVYKWTNVGGDPLRTFAVVQAGNKLFFHNVSSNTLSAPAATASIILEPFSGATEMSLTSVNGYLTAVCGKDKVAIISFDNGVISAEYSPILVRDTWGVEETTTPAYENDVMYRGGFDPIHIYNLHNQSWGIPRKGDLKGSFGSTYVKADPSEIYFSNLNKYPSNSEAVWVGLQFQPVSKDQEPFEKIYSHLYEEVLGASIASGKGYFVIDLLRRGQSRVAAFEANKIRHPEITVQTPNLPSDITTGGPTVIGEYAGRIWYAGFSGANTDGDKRSPSLSNHIAFSQLVRSKSDYNKCYQEGDPTSRESSDVVDTDGGFVQLSGAEKILALRDIGSHLVCIATNGVWVVSGGSDYGFSATNIKADKVSSFGGISASTVVDDGSRCFFWSANGIFVVTKDQYGSITVTSISENTIQSFYTDIPNNVKYRCSGVYDKLDKRIRWTYVTGALFTSSATTYELVFDTTAGVFTKNRLYNNLASSVQVVGLFDSEALSKNVVSSQVGVYTDEVYAVTDAVEVTKEILGSPIKSVRYVCMVNQDNSLKYTFCYYKQSSFIDWNSLGDGVDAKAFITTGDSVATDTSVAKQVPYVTLHFTRTESGVDSLGQLIDSSSCLMRSQWNWSRSSISNKWSSLRETYRQTRVVTTDSSIYDTGFDVLTTRNKIRGRGKSFALYMETSPAKNCIILGWNLNVTGNGNT